MAQGIGAAVMVPQVLSGIQLNFHGSARARALTYYPVALAGGAAAGQVLGGALISWNPFGASWRSIFLVHVPPILLGAGKQLFEETAGATTLTLVGTQTTDKGITVLTYEVVH